MDSAEKYFLDNRFSEIVKRMENTWAAAAVRAEQEKQQEAEQPTMEQRLENAKKHVEATLEKRGYDHAGIKEEHWDFIIQLASERLVKASLGETISVGEITNEHIGFILVGEPMAGKTFLMRLLAVIKAIPSPIGEATLKNDFQTGGMERMFSTYPDLRNRDFSLDDLGALDEVKSYGNGGLIKSILFERYEHWQAGQSCTTFISTNLEGYNDLKESYGIQIANRLANMCAIIPVQGKNKGVSVNKRFFMAEKQDRPK